MPTRLEGLLMYELLADPITGVYTIDLVWGRPRRRRFSKTSIKRGPRKAMTR